MHVGGRLAKMHKHVLHVERQRVDVLLDGAEERVGRPDDALGGDVSSRDAPSAPLARTVPGDDDDDSGAQPSDTDAWRRSVRM